MLVGRPLITSKGRPLGLATAGWARTAADALAYGRERQGRLEVTDLLGGRDDVGGQAEPEPTGHAGPHLVDVDQNRAEAVGHRVGESDGDLGHPGAAGAPDGDGGADGLGLLGHGTVVDGPTGRGRTISIDDRGATADGDEQVAQRLGIDGRDPRRPDPGQVGPVRIVGDVVDGGDGDLLLGQAGHEARVEGGGGGVEQQRVELGPLELPHVAVDLDLDAGDEVTGVALDLAAPRADRVGDGDVDVSHCSPRADRPARPRGHR